MKNHQKIEILANDYKPRLLCCSEARVTDDILISEYAIEGYDSIVCPSVSRSTGGVLIYIEKETKHRILMNESVDNIVWCLVIEIWDTKYDGVYCAFYRSPNKKKENGQSESNIDIFMRKFDEILDKIVVVDKLNVIIGDINIDMKCNDSNTENTLNMFQKYDLALITDFITRNNDRNGTIIDVVFTNDDNRVGCFPLENEIITDHKTIMIHIKNKEMIHKKDFSYVLSWSKYSKEQLLNNLSLCDWSNFNMFNINERLNLLRDNMTISVLPMIKRIKIKNTVIDKSWFDDELKTIKHEKVGAYIEWLKSERKREFWEKYIVIRNAYDKLIKKKKEDYTKKALIKAGNDQRKVWKHLNKIMTNKDMKINDEIDFDGVICNDMKQIPEMFNDFFIESINKINKDIPSVDEDNEQIEQLENVEFKHENTSVESIIIEANKLRKKVNKSEYLNSMVWSDAMDYVAYFLKEIINESYETGVIPENWKIATVTPIPKITNTNKAMEYRPINSMPTDEKIMEALVKTPFVRYLENNTIFTKHQSAFRKNHSCEATITYVINDWKECLDDGNVVIAVFLDLKRAFETVDRAMMIKKLEAIGVRNETLKWFKNYLEERMQQTKYKNHTSTQREVNIGLAQGTALSVILFNIYMNDIVKVPSYCKIVLFADDTMIRISAKTINEAVWKINYDLQKIYKWLNINKLLLNIDKTKWMLITRKNNIAHMPVELKIEIAGKEIQKVNFIKYLGFIIDDKITLNEQIKQVIKKTARKINFLKRIRNKTTYHTRKLIYITTIDTHFEYCATLLLACKKEQIKQLQKLQNRAMRMILKCEFRTPKKFMLNALNLMSIEQKIKYNSILMIYKMKTGKAPIYLSEKLRYNNEVHDRNTRQRNDIRTPMVTSELMRKDLFYDGIKLYNEVCNDIRKIDNLNEFKRKCKEYVKIKFPIG